jgi:hypothetical protein
MSRLDVYLHGPFARIAFIFSNNSTPTSFNRHPINVQVLRVIGIFHALLNAIEA